MKQTAFERMKRQPCVKRVKVNLMEKRTVSNVCLVRDFFVPEFLVADFISNLERFFI